MNALEEETLLGREGVLEHLERELRGGQTVLLHGPCGIGKSAVLRELAKRLRARGVPVGLAARGDRLPDATAALASAFPELLLANRSQGAVRKELRDRLERGEAVLLLDEVSAATGALRAWLKTQRGGRLGVVLAADLENERDKLRLRAQRLGYRELALEPLAAAQLRRLLQQWLSAENVPLDEIDRLARAAQGSPGRASYFARHIREPRYWKDRQLLVQLLAVDAEIARQANAFMRERESS